MSRWPAARTRPASTPRSASQPRRPGPTALESSAAEHGMRVLGLDLGSKRIGVAVSDRSGTIATPLTVVQRSGSRAQDHRRIAALVEEEEAERLVVGLPLSLSGELGPAAKGAVAEADQIASVVSVPVETFDERLTTVTADRALMEYR